MEASRLNRYRRAGADGFAQMVMSAVDEAVSELIAIFRANGDKHMAHKRSVPVLERISRSSDFIPAMLEKYLGSPASLNRGNYPVVAIELELNPWFSLAANCWVPLPDGNTNLSTKSIHHHGDLLLTTVTIFGPGYEHWTFTPPKPIDAHGDLFSMQLIEAALHPLHHVAFVDAGVAHVPFYPAELSITLALFSNYQPTTWRDRLKRLPGLRGRENQLRNLARKLGLARTLDLKTVDSFDFHPVDNGFAVIREREEFALGPNADHVASVFHVIQKTGNERLATMIESLLERGRITTGRAAVESLLPQLIQGKPIAPRLSPGHYDQPTANFTRGDILHALKASEGRHGR